mgnify:CR=1 FL=1
MMLKDKVAVVTGAARGIGREVSLLMAKHGAKVVVNDYGGGADGTGDARGPADDVVNEIKGQGGQAVANYDSVAEAATAAAVERPMPGSVSSSAREPGKRPACSRITACAHWCNSFARR